MLLKALDLLRTIGWGLIYFIFSLIDYLFDILKNLNTYDIINNISNNNIFVDFHSGILAISLTLLGLFSIWRFTVKMLEVEEGLSIYQIINEIFKCSLMVILSSFLFIQASSFSIKLSNYTGNIFSSNNISIGNSMLSMYITHSDGYKESDSFKDENIIDSLNDNSFNNMKKYNEKYITSSRWILPDEKDYKYSINWIMSIVVGCFFLYALFFSGMMLARRQIEFLFLFIISPIVFSTSIGNKQRRGAVIEQLVSLILQGAVVLLIICLTALVMEQIQDTTFFNDMFKDVLIKSLLYIGCGSFLLTGSQVVNRFIGGNVSVNSGREQMMALGGFGKMLSGITTSGALGTVGAGLIGTGSVVKGISKISSAGDSILSKVGSGISNFGEKIQNHGNRYNNGSNSISGIGANMRFVGNYIQNTSYARQNPLNIDGMKIPSNSAKLSRFASKMMSAGSNNINSAIGQFIPYRNMQKNRYRNRGDK